MTATDVRVAATVYDAVEDAYGYRRILDGPDDPCANCGHRLAGHSGEDWDGACSVEGCDCGGAVVG